MKTLLILRHGKAVKDDTIEDHDRALTSRGKKDSERMGRLLKEEHLVPDVILSSDAKRCRRTVEKVCDGSGYRGETILAGELYLATAENYLKALSRLSDDVSRVLLVGHNPGLEVLLELLVQRYEPLTTSALAHVRLGVEQWSETGLSTRGELAKLWQPMELA